MSNEKLAEQLAKLKEACAKWEKELAIYTKWAIDNDGVISASEKQEIDRRKSEIAAIKARIAQIEKAKGIQPKEEKSFLEQVYDGAKEVVETVIDKVKDFFDGDDDEKVPETAPLSTPANETTVETAEEKAPETAPAPAAEPKNKLGLSKEQVKDKLSDFFAAFDKFTVVVDGTTVEVETPYYMNEKGRSHKWDGNTVTAGKGSPKEVQEWLQEQIDKGKIKSKDPAKLRQYLKDNKIGVDCSGFVSQALNHVADKEGDMDYGSDDEFKPDATGSGTFTGNKFTKIAPANVQVGDTLYFKNPTGGVNHIRIVGDVRNEGGVIYYTIFESAGSTGPRKMEWKYENGKLMEYSSSKVWKEKTNETFYRWKELEMEVPSAGGAGEGQQQDQQQSSGTDQTVEASSTLSASVGKGGSNKKSDVLLVQELLNKKGASLKVDGDCGAKTIAAIEKFQKETVGFSKPDGKIDPGGKTWKALTSGTAPAAETTTTTETTTTESTNTTETTTSETTTETTTTPETTEVPSGDYEEVLAPNSAIKQSVGAGGKNDPADVIRVKQLLVKFGYSLTIDGNADAALTTAIKDFQTKYRGSANPDGRVDPGGGTWGSLLGIGRIQGQLLSMSQQYGVEPAVILAIQQIESGGNGYLPDGRPKILFEGHVFWRQLEAAGKNPNTLRIGNEDIIYPSFDRTKYQGGAKEYDRLERAKAIDEIAALKSASWGEFQIMGFNHAVVGYSDVKSFVEAMHVPNGASLKAVMEFCKNKNILRHVSGPNKDWAKFAYSYNGSGYAANQYDVKLAAAYERYKKIYN